MDNGNEKIINNNNYGKYIHYLESNLIGISFIKIFIYRLMSSFKFLLYIEKTGNLSIVEKGSIYVKKAQREQDYLLTKINASNYYSLFLKNSFDETNINLNDYSVIKHKLFKNFYLIYPSRNNLLKYVSKEGKINLIFLLFIIVFFVLGVFAIIDVLK